LKKYNPAYKRNIVNGTTERPKRLLVPVTNHVNDSLLYVALHNGISSDGAPNGGGRPKQYHVGHNETIYDVAKKFGVSIQNLRAWNGLTAKSAVSGKTLFVDQPINARLASNVNKATAHKKASSRVAYHVVRQGDSLDKIARRYKGLSVSKLKADNNLKSNLIRPGMRLKINEG